MRLVRAVLFFPLAFSLVRANGDGQAAGGCPKPGNVDAAALKQNLEFVKKLRNALSLGREDENRKKLLLKFPRFGAPSFDGAWGDLKNLLKLLDELHALLLKNPVAPAHDKDVGKTAVAILDILVGAATDAVTVADKAARAVTGMDPDKAVGFNVTPEVGEALFQLLPGMYDVLKELLKQVCDWVNAKSQFEERRLFKTVGDGKPKEHLRKYGFDQELNVETTLDALKAKLEELVGTDKPFDKVLCAIATPTDEVSAKTVAAGAQAAAAAQEAAAAAVQATPGLRKEGQGEDGAQFNGVGMAMVFVSVAVAVF